LPELTAQQTVTLAIVFADISESTRLYDVMGDTQARELVAQCLGVMTGVVHERRGTVIKTIGDELMCTFPRAGAAVAAARGMQEAVRKDLPDLNPNTPKDLTIRIGIQYGPAIVDGGDVFGDAVNVAARMTGQAKAGQIITTQTTVEALSPKLQASTRHLDRIRVKGKSGYLNIYEVVWQDEDVTHIASKVGPAPAGRGRLRLVYRGHKLTVSHQSGPLTLGRGKQAHLVVDDSQASRQHARIENRRGRFVLSDESTNGTYVLTTDGSVYLRREEVTLVGRGKISLGRDFADEPAEVVLFECES